MRRYNDAWEASMAKLSPKVRAYMWRLWAEQAADKANELIDARPPTDVLLQLPPKLATVFAVVWREFPDAAAYVDIQSELAGPDENKWSKNWRNKVSDYAGRLNSLLIEKRTTLTINNSLRSETAQLIDIE